ncbi:MAG: alpha/beta fold hydrolase [Opitutae bacterium]|nr:alpha/beta fold hydrolase [Opitutae bacterium]
MSEILLAAAAKRGVPVPPGPLDADALAELAAAIFVRPMRGARKVPRELGYLETARPTTLRTSHGELAAWEWSPPNSVIRSLDAGGAEVLVGQTHGGVDVSGAPLVGLVHGWEGHGAQLGAFAVPLAAAGFRVLAFDLPGHGESPGDEAHVPLVARTLAEIEREAGKFFALIGHSMGAAGAAMSTTLGVAPRGLVLLAPPQSQLERLDRVANRLQLAGELREKFFAAVERRTASRNADVDMRVVARAAPCALRVFHDPADEDASFAASEEFVELWRGARLVSVPGRGHYRILATPEIVRQAVEFLSGLR